MRPLDLSYSSKKCTGRRTAVRLPCAGRSRRARVVLGLEALEDRTLPSAITFTVDAPGDAGAGSGTSGDIRYCINQANLSTNTGSTIVLDTQAIGSNSITLTHGVLEISNAMTIAGPGANVLTVSGDDNSEVFKIDGGVSASISGLKISNGVVNNQSGAAEGGGIDNEGVLQLSSVWVFGCAAETASGSAEGGGIYNDGTMSLLQSTVSGNIVSLSTRGSGFGGGILNTDRAVARMTNDTVAGNSIVLSLGNGTEACDGAGIYNAGDIFGSAQLTMLNDTIADNTIEGAGHATGGGIFNGGSLTLVNSIVYNPQQGVANPDVGGSINTDGGNLFGSSPIQGASIFDLFNANPILGPLQINGGPTPTMALAPNSPAIGQGILGVVLPSGGFLAAPNTDQRDVARPASGMDIGAYQHQVAPPLPALPPLPVPPPGPPAPVGALSLFALGLGPGSQPDIFEVDQAGQVFALPLLGLFGGHASPVFLNGGPVMGIVMPTDNGVVGTLLGNGGQSYFAEFINLSNPTVLASLENALGNEIASLTHGAWPPSPPSQYAPGFSGTLTNPLYIDVSITDQDGDTVDLSGSSTVDITGDGNEQDGVNIAATIKLSQDYPLQPQGTNSSFDFSGVYTLTGHANSEGNGYYGGETFYLQSATGLILESEPGWTIYVNQGASPPYFTFTANLQQHTVTLGQGFGITASGSFYAAQGV